MSESPKIVRPRTPWHPWVAGLLSLPWNGLIVCSGALKKRGVLV